MDTSALRIAVGELWWMGILRATTAILFGVTTVFWPEITLAVLVYLLAAFVLTVGVVETALGLMSIKRRNTWWTTLLLGLIGIGVGVYLAKHPDIALGTFITLVGVWFLSWGVLELMMAFLNRLATEARVLSFITGAASLAAGIIVLLQPVSGGLAFSWVLGLYGIVYGILSLGTSIELRNDFEELTAARKR